MLSDREEVTWEVYLTDRLKLDLRRRYMPRFSRDQEDLTPLMTYLVCQQCRRQIERFNAKSKWPRRLTFLPWS